jgi:hypothetical protein
VRKSVKALIRWLNLPIHHVALKSKKENEPIMKTILDVDQIMLWPMTNPKGVWGDIKNISDMYI